MIRISTCLVVLEPKICQNESFQRFPRPRKKQKTKTKHENEEKVKVAMIILGISFIFISKLLHVWQINSLNILVQTHLGHSLCHPTLNVNGISYSKSFGINGYEHETDMFYTGMYSYVHQSIKCKYFSFST